MAICVSESVAKLSSSKTAVPDMAVFTTGEVKVLLVKVCARASTAMVSVPVSKGKFRIDTPGRLKKDVRKSLVNPKTGEIDQEVLGKLLERHPTFANKFQRLFQLQGNVMKSQAMRDGIIPPQPTGEGVGIPEEWIRNAMQQKGLTREEAIAVYKRYMRKQK